MHSTKKAALVVAAAGAALGAAAGSAAADSGAEALAVNSPGVGSGNVAQIPVDVPVNITGNTLTVIGALNPAFGNGSINH
ncbi:chaplin [Streptomyces lonarensis]|uniref:Chaplin n=2 Tax=Streptomyces lonarensis TaxID=700599 RepID=A0A7X6D0N7_9ACTN|nr:chaplin [Streptomyces lonarensis]NJQ05944.1 chaplin [Streptomyces lonarensis]